MTRTIVAHPTGHPRNAAAARRRARARQRAGGRGIAVLWLLAALPVFLLVLIFLLDIANLWLARVELENGLESAALSAVKEWGDAGGGDTLVPRTVGVAYAQANRVRAVPLTLVTNYGPADGPNQNLTCCVTAGNPCNQVDPTGNLIFGVITDINPDCPITFDAGKQAGCGGGTVLFDATGQGPGNLAQDNAWGIAFEITPNMPANITIQSVTIDLQAGGGTGTFDFTSAGPVLSDSLPAPIIPCQPDVFGFPNPAAQIAFSATTGTPSSLTITFSPDGGSGDTGFDPGDRIRFGARTTGVSHGGGQDDGDGIGRDHVRVTVVFAIGGVPQPPVSATYVDTTETSNDCATCSCPTPCVPNPSGIPDLPCPPASAPNNNGQSYVLMHGGGGNKFGVRAQAVVHIRSLFCDLSGMDCGEYCVSARATAMYDCGIGEPSLVRVDRFVCPGPEP